MPPIVFSNGVSLVGKSDGDVILSIPRCLLDDLQAAWQADRDPADGKCSDTLVVEAVRDLFEGMDGALQLLAQCGVPTEAR